MDLNLARTFARVVEARGFTAAARSLGIPKSSVSRSVARLEDQLGVRLLERSSRQFKLTNSGRAFYEGASRALLELSEAERQVADAQEQVRGMVRLAVPVSAPRSFVSELVMGFTSQHPGVQIDVSFTNEHVDLLGNDFDIALQMGPLPDSALVARKVGQLNWWWFASPSYLQRRGIPRVPSALQDHDCVVFSPRGEAKALPLLGPHGPEPVSVTGSLYSDDFLLIHELVLRGAGIGLLPAVMGDADQRAGTLVRVLEGYEVPGPAVFVVTPSVRHLPRRIALFRDAVIDHFRNGCAAEGASVEAPVPAASSDIQQIDGAAHTVSLAYSALQPLHLLKPRAANSVAASGSRP